MSLQEALNLRLKKLDKQIDAVEKELNRIKNDTPTTETPASEHLSLKKSTVVSIASYFLSTLSHTLFDPTMDSSKIITVPSSSNNTVQNSSSTNKSQSNYIIPSTESSRLRTQRVFNGQQRLERQREMEIQREKVMTDCLVALIIANPLLMDEIVALSRDTSVSSIVNDHFVMMEEKAINIHNSSHNSVSDASQPISPKMSSNETNQIPELIIPPPLSSPDSQHLELSPSLSVSNSQTNPSDIPHNHSKHHSRNFSSFISTGELPAEHCSSFLASFLFEDAQIFYRKSTSDDNTQSENDTEKDDISQHSITSKNPYSNSVFQVLSLPNSSKGSRKTKSDTTLSLSLNKSQRMIIPETYFWMIGDIVSNLLSNQSLLRWSPSNLSMVILLDFLCSTTLHSFYTSYSDKDHTLDCNTQDLTIPSDSTSDFTSSNSVVPPSGEFSQISVQLLNADNNLYFDNSQTQNFTPSYLHPAHSYASPRFPPSALFDLSKNIISLMQFQAVNNPSLPYNSPTSSPNSISSASIPNDYSTRTPSSLYFTNTTENIYSYSNTKTNLLVSAHQQLLLAMVLLDLCLKEYNHRVSLLSKKPLNISNIKSLASSSLHNSSAPNSPNLSSSESSPRFTSLGEDFELVDYADDLSGDSKSKTIDPSKISISSASPLYNQFFLFIWNIPSASRQFIPDKLCIHSLSPSDSNYPNNTKPSFGFFGATTGAQQSTVSSSPARTDIQIAYNSTLQKNSSVRTYSQLVVWTIQVFMSMHISVFMHLPVHYYSTISNTNSSTNSSSANHSNNFIQDSESDISTSDTTQKHINSLSTKRHSLEGSSSSLNQNNSPLQPSNQSPLDCNNNSLNHMNYLIYKMNRILESIFPPDSQLNSPTLKKSYSSDDFMLNSDVSISPRSRNITQPLKRPNVTSSHYSSHSFSNFTNADQIHSPLQHSSSDDQLLDADVDIIDNNTSSDNPSQALEDTDKTRLLSPKPLPPPPYDGLRSPSTENNSRDNAVLSPINRLSYRVASSVEFVSLLYFSSIILSAHLLPNNISANGGLLPFSESHPTPTKTLELPSPTLLSNCLTFLSKANQPYLILKLITYLTSLLSTVLI